MYDPTTQRSRAARLRHEVEALAARRAELYEDVKTLTARAEKLARTVERYEANAAQARREAKNASNLRANHIKRADEATARLHDLETQEAQARQNIARTERETAKARHRLNVLKLAS